MAKKIRLLLQKRENPIFFGGFAALCKFTPGATSPTSTLSVLSGVVALDVDAAGNLYVAYNDNVVSKFAPGATTPSATLMGLDTSEALASDAAGNLYVANAGSNTVSKFAPGATTPSATLSGLSYPDALAFDAAGNLYVANLLGSTVSKFAPGATAVSATLSGLSNPKAFAIDAAGDLYVANTSGNTVSIFTPGATTPSATLTGLNGPVALAFDGTGNLYVGNLAGTVSKFAPGATTPSATLTGVTDPEALAIDAGGDIYVANTALGTVSEFAPGATMPSATLTGLANPKALAFDSAGNLYVANSGFGTVSKFAPGATNPFATLSGLNSPDALAFDAAGNLYVANTFTGTGGTVSKFTPGATTPSATFTGLSHPDALALDAAGNLYVANAGNGTVSKFAPGATTPSATFNISLSGAGSVAIQALAVTAGGSLFVAEGITVTEFPASYTINDGNGGANYAVTTIANTSGVVTPAPLTIAATTNTKTYDATTIAAALPTVSGLFGGDTVTDLSEVYSNATVGSGKTLTVSGFLVNDGNNGKNYSVTMVNDTTGVIVPGPFSKFVDTLNGGNTVVAGASFLFVVQASDQYGNAVSTYSGPASVTTSVSPIDPLGNFPVTGSLQISSAGFGFFLGNLQTAGTYTLTTSGGGFPGSSSPITVIPAGASYFTVAAPANASTGGSFNVTVRAHDQYGNVETDYTGTVQLTGATALGNPYTFTTGAGKDNGMHTFSVTLNTGGNQTISATDTTSTNPTISGTSNPISTRGLVVTAFTPTPTGFTASFSKAFIPNDLTLYGTNKTTVQDVTLVGTHVGPIHGSLIIDPSNMSVTFKATASYLLELNSVAQSATVSAVLPDDTYKVTLVSGSGGNGFIDALGAHLDGANSGGHANFTTSFTTQYQANSTPVLGIPDFARGPDSNSPIKVPNDSANGIPLTLYNAANVTDVTFSLTYNPSLFNITGALSGDASDATDAAATLTLVSNAGGLATFHYTDTNPQSATAMTPLVLGDIMAVVPSGNGAPALSLYQTKELLQLGSIVINQGTITGAVSANGVHVNAYFGDVTGGKVVTGLDTLGEDSVAQGHATGFSAYTQLDPVIIGDVAGDKSIDAGDVSAIDSFVGQLHPTQIPQPPTQLLTTDPNYVNPSSIHSPNAADPTLSLTRGLTALGSPVVSVMIDHPDPEGSTGLTSVTLALTYDPALLSVSPADITLGSIPSGGTGWQLTAVVDQATGQIGIQLYSLTPITVNQAGSLVNITFQLIGGPTGVIPPVVPSVQLVDAVTPNGYWFGTGIADAQGALILSTGVDQLLAPTGA